MPSRQRAEDGLSAKELMKILVKNLRTGLFLAGARNWTARERDALRFANSPAAYDYCQSHDCRYGAAIVFRFRNPRHDIVFKTS